MSNRQSHNFTGSRVVPASVTTVTSVATGCVRVSMPQAACCSCYCCCANCSRSNPRPVWSSWRDLFSPHFDQLVSRPAAHL